MDLLIFKPVIAVQLMVPHGLRTSHPPLDTLAGINPANAQTLIQEGIATSLGLQPKGAAKVITTTSFGYEVREYVVRLVLPDAGLAFEILVAEIPYMPQTATGRIKCLLGRDILQYGVLTYDGPAKICSLVFGGVSDGQRRSAASARG